VPSAAEMRRPSRRVPPRPQLVIDASAVLAAFLPEEAWETQADALLDAYRDGRIELIAPTLLSYEILNSLYVATRGKAGQPARLNLDEADRIWNLFRDLRIGLIDVGPTATDALDLAFGARWRSVYDLVYVTLARHLGTKLITADAQLARAFDEAHPIWDLSSLSAEW